MKSNMTRVIKIAAFLLPVIIVFAVASYGGTAGARSESFRISNFYLEEPESLDVVLLGASELPTAFSPGLAYQEFGITSYPYAIGANHIDLYKSQLKEIYRTQSPDLVVVDLNPALCTETADVSDSILRIYTQGMPLTKNKIETIAQFGDQEHLLSYYVPFLLTHSVKETLAGGWRTITRLVTEARGYSLLKGIHSEIDTLEPSEFVDAKTDDSKSQPAPEVIGKLVDFLEFCRENGYDNLVFTEFPHLIHNELAYNRFKQVNYLEGLINSYGYDLLNFDKQLEEIGADPYADFYNSEHMNVYGQQKFTRYFCRILMEEYGVTPGNQSDQNRENWEQSALYTDLFYDYFARMKQEGENYDMLWETWSTIRTLNSLKQPAA